MGKKLFFGQKAILESGREVDLSSDQENNSEISVLAILNHLDPIHEITKPLSIRMAWNKGSEDPVVSIECRGGSPGERGVSEAEMPIEGINGSDKKLQLSELVEIQAKMTEVYEKIKAEA